MASDADTDDNYAPLTAQEGREWGRRMVAALQTAKLGGVVSEGRGFVTMDFAGDIFDVPRFLAMLPPHTVNIVQPHSGKLEPGAWMFEFAPLPSMLLRNTLLAFLAVLCVAVAVAVYFFFPNSL